MYVYADVVFFINLAMNMAILLLTAWIAGIRYTWFRLIGAASLGGIFVLGCLMPQFYLLNYGIAKFFLSMLLIVTAFGRRKIRTFLLLVGTFYIVSFVLGGAVLGWFFFWQNGGAAYAEQCQHIFAELNWLNLAGGTSLGLLLGGGLLRYLFPQLLRRCSLYKVRIKYSDRFTEFTAMLDTGNNLYTVIGRKPVVLVNQSVLKGILGEETACFICEYQSDSWLKQFEQYRDQPWISRVQMIPYQAVGSSSVLLGFRPDCLTVYTKSGEITTSEVVLGIYSGMLSTDSRYEGLLHPAIIQV
ncbi:MAG: sigma-E processing peptidase SpoIIGA [Veillonellales bacterium]